MSSLPSMPTTANTTPGMPPLSSLVEHLIPPPEQITVRLCGDKLTVPQLIAIAQGHAHVAIDDDPAAVGRVQASVDFLKSKLHTSIYGVTTGFGGSADTRTPHALALQVALLEHQLCGVSPRDVGDVLGDPNVLPEHVVRGAMIVRVNSLMRGHSAVRVDVLEMLVQFIERGITPVVPLRGSISASGDLSPLSYIAASLTGHPDVKCRVRSANGSKLQVMSAPDALHLHGLSPVTLGPKEGLGLINGTAVSAAMGAFALDEALVAHLLSQALTGMTVEAMLGTSGSFHPFIHDVTRPHPGQVNVARFLRAMLSGSKLATHHEEERNVLEDAGVLRQDRYPLRTAPQFLGPGLEELIQSLNTIALEINTTTDNPLVDVAGQTTHHGGNFQASSVGYAMDKIRIAIQHMGKIGFAQMTELANCSMNRGLPSCLAAEDPSTNYHVKGLDIAAASYCSELGFLANPVSSHVQSAEMGNQAVNSLALVSARKTTEALDVLTMLLSTHLYCVCQAIDLRFIDLQFRESLAHQLKASIETSFGSMLGEPQQVVLLAVISQVIAIRLDQTSSMDLEPRWRDAFDFASSKVVDALAESGDTSALSAVVRWRKQSATDAAALMRKTRDDFFAPGGAGTVADYLGGGSRELYTFVRQELGIKTRRGDVYSQEAHGTQDRTVGSSVSTIFDAVKSGRVRDVVTKLVHRADAAA